MSKKRAAHTTRGRQGRKPTPAKATDPAPVKPKAPVLSRPFIRNLNRQPVEEKPKARSDPAGKFTLDEAIEWFKKDPHAEAFFCTGPAGSAIAQGNHYLQFNKGNFVTSDPAEVEVLMRSREFNLFIYAVNPTLRNLK